MSGTWARGGGGGVFGFRVGVVGAPPPPFTPSPSPLFQPPSLPSQPPPRWPSLTTTTTTTPPPVTFTPPPHAMFHPLPLPRIHVRKHARPDPCTASVPRATDRPSLPVRRGPRYPAPAGCTTKKAPPTLSVSNTHVSRSGATPVAFPNDVPEQPPRSVIPFPSAPIDFPVRRADREDDFDVCGASERLEQDEQNLPVEDKAEIRRDVDWRRIRRRCTQSCTVGSYIPPDNMKAAATAASKEDPPRRPFSAVLVNRATESNASDAEPGSETLPCRVRRHSISAGCGPSRPAPRRARKVKKPAVDVQYIAVVHRSIALHARVAREHGGPGQLDACVEQDVELAMRLWKILAKRGCRPTLLKSAGPSPSPTGDENAAPAAPTSRSVDDSSMAKSAEAQPTPAIPDHPVSSSAPSVLSMPQLVASMTLRFRDRSTVRPRSSASLPKDAGFESPGRPPRPRSALGHVVYSSGEGEGTITGAN